MGFLRKFQQYRRLPQVLSLAVVYFGGGGGGGISPPPSEKSNSVLIRKMSLITELINLSIQNEVMKQ